MSLLPASQSGSDFSQQGTVDWTSVANLTYSASVAVLARLSGAGLEPLTVAIAQCVCLNLPIGVHGERRLSEAMSTLKSFSTFGDAIWLGVGVRHVLRSLVQTSQGASSVALAACLSEGHSIQFSAYVLYELAQVMGSPSELTPSYSQWERYTQTCAGLFSTSIFAHKMEQLARLCGFTAPTHLPEHANNKVAQPSELAKTLRGIGLVQMGKLERIEIVGGPECCWGVVFCDFILSLRVELRSANDEVLFQNFGSKVSKAQIRYRVATAASSSLYQASRTFTLCSTEFLSRWHFDGYQENSLTLLNGRVMWDSVLKECFEGLRYLVLPSKSSTGLESPGYHGFGRLFGAVAVLFYTSRLSSTMLNKPKDTLSLRYGSPEDFIQHAIASLPELRPLLNDALSEVIKICGPQESRDTLICYEYGSHRGYFLTKAELEVFKGKIEREEDERPPIPLKMYGDIERRATSAYCECRQKIRSVCPCKNHISKCTAVAMCQTMMVLAYLLGELIMDDNLSPSRLGIQDIYGRLLHDNIERDDAGSIRALLFLSEKSVVTGRDLGTEFADLFEIYLRLFSGYGRTIRYIDETKPKISAVSDGGLYCYVDFLRSPTQSYGKASRVHVGRGAIQISNRTYPTVLDQDADQISEHYFLSSSPNFLYHRWKAMVTEHITLHYWYEDDRTQAEARVWSLNPMWSLARGWDIKEPEENTGDA